MVATAPAAIIPVFDGHNDTILELVRPAPGRERTFFEEAAFGHIDLPRARRGGLAGGFFAVFIPSPRKQSSTSAMQKAKERYSIPLPKPLKFSYAVEFATNALGALLRLEGESAGQARIVRSAAELEQALAAGIFAILLHFEGAEPIDASLNNLYAYHAAGLRSLGLVWSRPNIFASGVPFRFPAGPDIGPGLTDAGKALVRACNELGILIDLSHLNEKGFWDVAAISDAPLVATHSCAHALCPSPRNLTDKQLDAVRASGGVVGVNFHTGFLRPDGRSGEETSLEEIANHVDYMVQRMGLEHVALGSDFDGATMPGDLADVAGLPRLIEALRRRGYDDEALRRLAHGNWVRVLRPTLRG